MISDFVWQGSSLDTVEAVVTWKLLAVHVCLKHKHFHNQHDTRIHMVKLKRET